MDETFSYDGNGNIKTTLRHGGFTAPRDMDDLAYNYNVDGSGHLVNNRLRHINDNITFYPDNNTHDLSNQVTDNYHYDAIGNLIADQETGISNVDWTVYGKIKAITKTSGNGPSLVYTYDPAGQRATKLVNGVTTWYVRDASGNTMAVYDNKGGTTNWREQDLYGSSRLGLWAPNMNLASNNASTIWDTIGHKQYELANHLGNVLATITDKRIPHSSNGTTIDYYNPETTTAQDYYAFGFQVPMRGYTLGKPYRYGFNGKENDSDVKIDFDGNNIPGSQQDYGMRIYDPRVGRFLSVDPLTIKYPELTPYQFASNTPIQATDLDGLEANFSSAKLDVQEHKSSDDITTTISKAENNIGAFGYNGLVDGAEYLSNINPIYNLTNKGAGIKKVLNGAKETVSKAFDYLVFTSPQQLQKDYVDLLKSPYTYEQMAGMMLTEKVTSFGFKIFSKTSLSSFDAFLNRAVELDVPVEISPKTGWKLGDPIMNLTSKGKTPSWNTVRGRFWKNEALNNSFYYSKPNLLRMKVGLAPQRINPLTNLMESMELHHHIVPQRDGGLYEFIKVWPDEHKALDPFRR